MKLVDMYNHMAKDKLKANGYGPIIFDGREYCLGIAELDSEFTEFMTHGAKRYCKRDLSDGELHITVAGVPKKGFECLKNDINNFRPGLIFDGKTTGKLQHSYHFVEELYIDRAGNESGDYIDLQPGDYLLSTEGAELVNMSLDDLFSIEEGVQVYDEGELF